MPETLAAIMAVNPGMCLDEFRVYRFQAEMLQIDVVGLTHLIEIKKMFLDLQTRIVF